MATRVTMDRFVDELQDLARSGFAPDTVHDYMARTLIDEASLERFISYRDDRYTRNLIVKNDAFELLVICWNVGQSAPIHGHEGEHCWARVERGTLRFSNYRVDQEQPLAVTKLATLDGCAGHLDGPAEVHAVENCTEFATPSASLHLYSKPFDECDIYDLERRAIRRVALAYDTVGGQPSDLAI